MSLCFESDVLICTYGEYTILPNSYYKITVFDKIKDILLCRTLTVEQIIIRCIR